MSFFEAFTLAAFLVVLMVIFTLSGIGAVEATKRWRLDRVETIGAMALPLMTTLVLAAFIWTVRA